MPLPPALIIAFTFSSVTFLPVFSLSCLKRPLSDGPLFFSSLSVLWHTPHCSKTSLPLSGSPLVSAAASNPASKNPPAPKLKTFLRIPRTPPGWTDPPVYNLRRDDVIHDKG